MSQQSATVDVVGIGNALVDVISHETDAFVDEQGLVKGSMNLIETERAEALYDRMGPGVEMSGGSAANTMVGVAALGGRAAYVGKVSDDQLGQVFTHDLRATGVPLVVPPAPDGAPTGRCLILVTPDAQRTMNTYLGASVELHADDVDDEVVRSAKAVYLEGYLWDRPEPKRAMARVARVATESSATVALTLSDSFCVDRHRESFLELIDTEVDLLFANDDEIMALYECDDLETALAEVVRHCPLTTVTLGAKGSVVVTADGVRAVPAHPVTHIVDTTGAGDLYAAGFLYGLTHGHELEVCARLGNLAAGEVITHVGARPLEPLDRLAAELLDPTERK